MITVVFLLAGRPIGAQAIAVLQARGASFQKNVVVGVRGECQARRQVFVISLAVAIGEFNVIVGLTVFLTEFTSNTATATMLYPIMASLAAAWG